MYSVRPHRSTPKLRAHSTFNDSGVDVSYVSPGERSLLRPSSREVIVPSSQGIPNAEQSFVHPSNSGYGQRVAPQITGALPNPAGAIPYNNRASISSLSSVKTIDNRVNPHGASVPVQSAPTNGQPVAKKTWPGVVAQPAINLDDYLHWRPVRVDGDSVHRTLTGKRK